MSNKRWVISTLILCLAALGRILHIGEQSFWVDEGYAFYHANYPSLITSLARDTHPPLYFAALRIWSEIAGHSELALRWFSVLPSMLSLGVVYQFAREFCRHRRGDASQYEYVVPLLAMLMLALADAENFLAQETRHYTWLTLVVVCSMWCFLRWLRLGRRRAYLMWILFSIAMVYTHYITAFAGVAQGLYAIVWTRGRTRLQVLLGLILSALALTPWLLEVGRRQLGNSGANWSVKLTPDVAREILVKYFTEQWALIIVLLLLGCFTVVHLGESRFQLKTHRATWLVLLWLIVPLLMTLMVNEYLPFLQPRRLTLWTPAIALLVAFGLANIRLPAHAVLVSALVIYGIFQVDFYRVKPDWRTVANMTSRYAVPGDLVLTDIAGGDYQMAYYLRRDIDDAQSLSDGITYRSLKVRRDFYGESYQEWLPQLLDGFQTVWLMHWSGDGSAFAWLDQLDFQQTADFVYKHDGGSAGEVELHIYRFDRIASDPILARWQNGMILQSAKVDVEDLRLDLLFRSEEPQSEDYTVSAKLFDAQDNNRAQIDSQPQHDQRPTSGWSIGELVYSPQELEVFYALEPGTYELVLQVYLLEDSSYRNVATVDGQYSVVIGAIQIDGDHAATKLKLRSNGNPR